MAIPIPEQRILDFEDLGFGMFVHFGLYSQLGQGEWVQHIQQIPKEEYGKLMDTFTAKGFDAKALVATAKKAGMKYITLTTRHHDGFSLYDTCGLNDFDAPHSPAKRDLIREFVDACNEEAIVPFLYHTTLDWYMENFKTDFAQYQKYLRASIEVLCTRYGKIGGLWFDGNWSDTVSDWEEDALYSLIRKHQPDAIIINNSGMFKPGMEGHKELDSTTFEQGRPTAMNRDGMSKYLAAEMCQTLNNHWGFGSGDFNYKSLPEIIENFCSCRKVGANYLLNIGPDGEGSIPKMQEAMLELLGEWIEIYKEAIFDVFPHTVIGQGKDFSLKSKNGKVYLFVHQLSISGHANVTVSGINGVGPRVFTNCTDKIDSIKWIDNGEILKFVQDTDTGVACVNCTGFPYGCDYVVRIAEVVYEK